MKWETLFMWPNSMTLLLARPGWGKTSLVIDLYEKRKIKKIVFMAPLKALANEVGRRVTPLGGTLLSSKSELGDLVKGLKDKTSFFIVGTVESFSEEFFHAINEKDKEDSTLIIFDEWHLFNYWGDTFRAHLWEMVMFISSMNFPILGMTATLDQPLVKRWENDFKEVRDERFLIDLGNQKLKTKPRKHLYIPPSFKKNLNHLLLRKLFNPKIKRPVLYFCRYREEVDRLVDFTRRQGLRSLGCVGGGVEEFCDELEKSLELDCIFATTTLSHGVNLPELEAVFISYPLENKDFWIQMVGRAGRRGESFDLIECDGFEISGKNKWIHLLKNIVISAKLLF